MSSPITSGLIIKHRKIRDEYYEMEFIAPELARQAEPGQFLHLKVGDNHDPLLRRPISIADVDKAQGTITLLYRVVGRGTELLSRLPVEARIDLMGPLGNGFTTDDSRKSVLVVGGGIGVAPLVYLTRVLISQGVYVQALLGAANSHHLLGRNRLQLLGAQVSCSTDDGSLGLQGRVTDLLDEVLTQRRFDYYYACGPMAMLQTLQQIGETENIAGELSLEAHMACGIGACLGCAHPVKRLGTTYAKVCVDGPVFSAREVVFDA
ncbi:MAG: dihydroorotate dehydrogenase electron transfer subunit [Methylocystaceae bacterium]